MVLLDAATKQLDVAFVEREILPTLSPALVALARERPADPVTWLAEHLLKTKPPRPLKRVPQRADALTLLHFNDVYNCEAPKKKKAGGAPRFISALKAVAAAAPSEAVTFFSGDCFNPSIMSTVVKGGQLPLVLNAAGVKCAVIGNHDFDFGPQRLAELITECDFPWLCSNVQKANDDAVYDSYDPLVEGLKEYAILEVGGRKLGCIGLVEEDWLETLFGIPRSSIAYEHYTECAERLCKMLRAPPHSCDTVLALTHMRQPNDDALGAACAAIGIDVVLAGHDHHYGVTHVNGTPIFKSGYDFETFTEIEL